MVQLRHNHPPIDVERLAGNRGGILAGKIDGEGRNFDRFEPSADWCASGLKGFIPAKLISSLPPPPLMVSKLVGR